MSGDVASGILQAFLPVSGSTIGATSMSAGMTVFVASLMGLASAMLCWHTLVGLVNTAWSGRVLGDGRWHQVWAPIRVSIGFGMLTPVVNGWPGIVLLAGQIAAGSNTLANSVWSATLSAALTPATATVQPGIPSSVGGLTLVTEVLKAEICTNIDKYMSLATPFPPLSSPPPAGGTFFLERLPWGGTQYWTYAGGCGGFSLPVPDKTAPPAMAAYSQARISAFTNLISAVRQSVAVQIAGAMTVQEDGNIEWPTTILPTLQPIAQAYDAAMLSASVAYISSQNQATYSNLQAAATTGGWMTAFGLDRALAQASQQIAQMASQAPTWNAPLTADKGDVSGVIGLDERKLYAAAASRLDAQIKNELGAGALTASDLAAGGDAQDGWMGRVLDPLDHKIGQAIIDWTAADTTDPVGDLMTLGAKLSAAGEAGIAANLLLAPVACNAVGIAAGACEAFRTATTFARPVFWAAIAAGWTLQFLLPMLPWIAGLWLSVGWAIATAEVIIAGPIGALLMVRMDGQELIDHVQRPYLIVLLNWALRPTLAVLSFAAYRILLSPCMALLKKGFSVAYVGNQGGHIVGILGTLGGVLLLSMLSWQMMLRLTAIIISIPDKIPMLLGFPGGGVADAEAHGGGTKAIVAMGGGVAGGAARAGGSASKIPSGGGGGGAPGLRPVVGGGGAGPGHWTRASGGLEGLTGEQQQAAQSAYGEWAQENPGPASKYGLSEYVDYAQRQEAARSA